MNQTGEAPVSKEPFHQHKTVREELAFASDLLRRALPALRKGGPEGLGVSTGKGFGCRSWGGACATHVRVAALPTNPLGWIAGLA